ncbi:hypothetical protein E2562_028167 [Oryza meyeriana var. granulata]|uniref:ArsA/GET3 Anion-transporting ATPase-like domain-containing protein n=1 Tax=Oryza meyeriana var. granulata TaxID=110450 RepID=A0A6G1D8G8_9ORYZ|nr:hypothetical protein E2562_028167 [Oryza meyeriana var. granulata]
MAALLNPTVRRLALAGCRRHPTLAAAAEPLVPHWRSQARYTSNLVEVDGGLGEMLAGSPRYYMIGGKGGVGKTSIAASLAVMFANRGEPTLIVSTDPHSLGDSFEQDVSGGKIIPVSGVHSLFAAEIRRMKKDPFYHLSSIRDFVSRAELGAVVDTNELNEMLHKAPVVFSELLMITQVIKSVEEESNNFRRIVLDTVATGHALKLLHGANWLEKALGLLIKAMNATSPPAESTIGKEKLDLTITQLEEVKQPGGQSN